jgi:hypothetical protein
LIDLVECSNFKKRKPLGKEKKYKTFRSFYPYYLTEHQDPVNRLLHFSGTALIIVFLLAAIVFRKWWLIALIPISGYGFAWVGHYLVEKNRPATFTYPLYSLGSDFVMFWHILTGQLEKKLAEANNLLQNK